MNKNMKTVLICHRDTAYLERVEESLEEKGFDVDSINNAADLLPTAIRLHPSVILADPQMPSFNAYDICKHIIQGKGISLILIIEKNASTRSTVGECTIDDVVSTETDINQLANLLNKHLSVHQ